MPLLQPVRAGLATVVGFIFIPGLITDPQWRNILLWFVGLYVLYLMTERDEMLQPWKRAVLITGCDTGLGHGMAKYFDRQGFRVFAGCLFNEREGAETLKSTCSERLKVLQLDITKEEQVKEALETVKKDLGGEGLWGLVNNAGILQFAEVELTPLRVFQQHFDVNCMGQIRMVKAFLPLIQRAKGRIVNFASMSARLYTTMFSAYCISKAGVELFSHVLRLEMMKWGVMVSTVFPVGFDTNMTRYASRQKRYLDEIKETLNDSQKLYYNDTYFGKVMERSTWVQRAQATGTRMEYFSSSDYSMVFHGVEHALLSQAPKASYPVGHGTRFLMTLVNVCPYWLLDRLLTATTHTHFERDLKPIVNMNFEQREAQRSSQLSKLK